LPNASHIRSRRIHLTIYQSNATVYLSDRKGYGKTTLLREIIETTQNTVVVAPRNCCLNAGGVTIHSMFQLPFGGFIPAFNVESQFTETVKFESKDTWRHFKMGGLKKSVIRNMELLIIDEVVCFADLLDAMDYMMQTVRKRTTLRWGSGFVYR
jgi:molybdopterin-guanine dinucleotide biosynthesis protein